MGIATDIKLLYHLALRPVRGKDHAARMEDFYKGQAGAYDDFRKRLLKGREEMYQSLDWPDGAVWVDLGGGTGSNLECVAEQVPRLSQVYVVDLAESLLKVCEERAAQRGWANVTARAADATTFMPPERAADVVTFSYSLTMIPDWFAAIDNALAMLRPGGQIGVVDFYVSRKHAEADRKRHSFATRHFWRTWFDGDSVYPSPDHVPYLTQRFEKTRLEERRARIPYLPLVRAPYYIFTGRKAEVGSRKEGFPA